MKKRTLYLGTSPATYIVEGDLIHYPIIRILPRPIPQPILDDMPEYTHLVFTSKNGVAAFFQTVPHTAVQGKEIIAVGEATAAKLRTCHVEPTAIAEEECQEGVIALLRPLDLDNAYILLARSASARHAIDDFLIHRDCRFQVCDLYDTVTHKPGPLPDLTTIDEIVFTSPSTVAAFLELFPHIPAGKTLKCQGAVTEEALAVRLQSD